MNRSARRQGYSLVEMLIFIALFGVVVNLCGGVFLMSSRLSTINTLQLDRVNGVREVEEMFVRAVRESAGVVEAAGGFTTSEDQLVLRTGADSYRAIGLLRGDNRLGRMDFSTAETPITVDYLRTLSQRVKNVRFSSQDGLATLEFEVQEETGERLGQARVHRITAAPRMAVFQEEATP